VAPKRGRVVVSLFTDHGRWKRVCNAELSPAMTGEWERSRRDHITTSDASATRPQSARAGEQPTIT